MKHLRRQTPQDLALCLMLDQALLGVLTCIWLILQQYKIHFLRACSRTGWKVLHLALG